MSCWASQSRPRWELAWFHRLGWARFACSHAARPGPSAWLGWRRSAAGAGSQRCCSDTAMRLPSKHRTKHDQQEWGHEVYTKTGRAGKARAGSTLRPIRSQMRPTIALATKTLARWSEGGLNDEGLKLGRQALVFHSIPLQSNLT